MKGGIFIVIYVDVLFIINFFITFLLLSLTSRLAKRSAKVSRFVFASALGGAYSLIILVNIPTYISFVLKFASALLIVFAAFGKTRVKSLAALLLLYLFSSLVFLGIIIGIYFVFKSEKIAVNNGTVYFDIGARGLLLSAFFAYIIACAVVRVYNRRLSSGEIYTLKIERQGQSVTLFALADNGNRLREPFSGDSVIVAKSEKVSALAPENLRVIPAATVNNSSYLKAFKPDRVEIKNNKGTIIASSVYVALSDSVNSDEYSAVFNPEILSV